MTHISQFIGADTAMAYHELVGQSDTFVADLNAMSNAATDRGIVFVDGPHDRTADWARACLVGRPAANRGLVSADSLARTRRETITAKSLTPSRKSVISRLGRRGSRGADRENPRDWRHRVSTESMESSVGRRPNMGELTMMCTMMIAAIAMFASADKSAGEIPLPLKEFKFVVPEDAANLFGYDEGEDRLYFYTNGKAEITVKVPTDGAYELVIRASGEKVENVGPKFRVLVDGKAIKVGAKDATDVTETELSAEDPTDYKVAVKLTSGERKVVIEFTNDAYKENEYDRNLYVHAVALRPTNK